MFQDSMAIGSQSRSSSQLINPSDEDRVPNVNMNSAGGSHSRLSGSRGEDLIDIASTSGGSSCRRRITPQVEKETHLIEALDKWDDLMDVKSNRIGTNTEKSKEYCIEALRYIEGVSDSLFAKAINALQSTTMRSFFTRLDDRDK